MFSLTCIITVESTAQIEAQWSVQPTCFHCRRTRPHTDPTSASCCEPCRHVIPTVCPLHHPPAATPDGDAAVTEEADARKRNSNNQLDVFLGRRRRSFIEPHEAETCSVVIDHHINTYLRRGLRLDILPTSRLTNFGRPRRM